MSMGGDFDPQPIAIPGITYTPSFEYGVSWATEYNSQFIGCLALSQNLISTFASNFITRDIGGRTAGICVTPWDFNFVKAQGVDDTVIERPTGFTRTSFTPCDCSYHLCDRDFESIDYTLNFQELWEGEPGITGGLKYGIQFMGIPDNEDNKGLIAQELHRLGLPASISTSFSDGGWDSTWTKTGSIDETKYNTLRTAINSLDGIIQGSKESNLLTFALMDLCGSVTAGVFFKNNIMSALAFAQDTYTIPTQDYGEGFESGTGDFTGVISNIVGNYANRANIPGFTAESVFKVLPGTENVHEYCMCLDAGMYGMDAVAFADKVIVEDQLTVEPDPNIGGMAAFQSAFNFEGLTIDLAPFLSIDGQYLKTLGVTGAKPYKYGPNWAYGTGLSELNVVALAIPAFKNWEVRDSAKIRMSGTPNGEPFSFGNQWLEWGQRIGIPPIEYVKIDSKTIDGGNFTDCNFGYRGSLEGSLIYRGRLKEDVLAYETQDYEFAFSGITYGEIGESATKYFLGLTTIRDNDAVSNEQAYGVTGSIEEIIFNAKFSESPQDKTVYRM